MSRRRLACLAASALLAVPTATAGPAAPPHGLTAFLLRADEPARRSFPRTPSLAWTPVAGARSYTVQLAASRRFDAGSLLWSSGSLRSPAAAIPVALPWTSGSPSMLYVRVRALTRAGATGWSAPLGFDLEPPAPPAPLPAPDGLVRWQPVAGATAYDVWFLDANKILKTTTNVADERELWSFHRDAAHTARVRWRVRAVRRLYGHPASGLPAVDYGPWSDTYVTTNAPPSSGPLRLGAVVSDAVSEPGAPRAHALTPGFAFSGDTGFDGRAHGLFRVHVFTDRSCVNLVYSSAVVGSAAYAPRSSGPLRLPADEAGLAQAATTYLPDGVEGPGRGADQRRIVAQESVHAQAAGAAPASGTAPAPVAAAGGDEGALVDLWDSGWPTGRYTWTVVPVDPVVNADGVVEYDDAELAQDVCRRGRVGSFGKRSAPAVTSAATPFASGLSPHGRLLAARGGAPAFYGAPLVAWEPAPGAQRYEVQASRTPYPWRTELRRATRGTSALLDGLAPGTWWYRVRGLDDLLPGPAKAMSWSQPVELRLAPPTLRVVRG